MADNRQLKSIGLRYDVEVVRHPDLWRKLRSRLSYIFFFGTIIACIPWLLGDHRPFQSQCVSNAHRVFEQDCSTCHDRSTIPIWRMVTLNNSLHSTSDNKCRVCHRETTGDHLALSISSNPPTISSQPGEAITAGGTRFEALVQQLKQDFDNLGCADCHIEHRGHSSLSEVTNANCSNCHVAAHKQIASQRFQLDFSDFGHHPEFGVWRKPADSSTLPDPEARLPEVVRWDGDKPIDQSVFRFSHHRHLDPKLPTHGGKTVALACSDCHRLEAGGAYFLPISFEQNCQQCHKLGFKATGELPHSNPDIIRGILLDRLTRKSIEVPAAADEIGGPTKRPLEANGSAAPSPLEQLKSLEQRLFATAPEESSAGLPRVAGLLEAACTKCHFTEQTPAATDPWKVIPPQLPNQWMVHSRFRHDSHSAVDCQACHTRSGNRFETVPRDQFYPVMKDELRLSSSIYASASAQDVLLPRIAICRQCHGDESADRVHSAVKDRCVDCHGYHHTPITSPTKPGMIRLLKSERTDTTGTRHSETPLEAGP